MGVGAPAAMGVTMTGTFLGCFRLTSQLLHRGCLLPGFVIRSLHAWQSAGCEGSFDCLHLSRLGAKSTKRSFC